jgi:hypothetical protein
MSTAALNQSSRNIESLRGGEVESLGSEGATTGVDINTTSTQNEDIGDSWIIDQGCQWTQSTPGLSTEASRARGGDQPGNTRHLLSVTGCAKRWGDSGVACGKPPFLSSSPLF